MYYFMAVVFMNRDRSAMNAASPLKNVDRFFSNQSDEGTREENNQVLFADATTDSRQGRPRGGSITLHSHGANKVACPTPRTIIASGDRGTSAPIK